MASLFRDIVSFVGAVLRHWVVLMSGTIMTIYALVERNRGSEIAARLYWPIIIVFIATAVFLAWRTERQRWERLGAKTLALSVADLVSVYKNRTDVQGEALASIYKGKWLTVSGKLGNVTVYNSGLPLVKGCFVTFGHSLGYPTVMMRFSGSWARKLSILPAAEPITVSGRISEVERSTVRLEDCELVYLPTPSEGAHHAAPSQNVGSIPNSNTD